MSENEPTPVDAAPLRVAYLLHRFPYLTETFIVREMHHVRRHGVDLTIYSLLPPKHEVTSPRAAELVQWSRYSRPISLEVLRAQWHFIRRSPLRYLRAYGRVVRQTYREPSVLLLMTALFPKAVFFARDIEESGISHMHAHFVWIEGIAAGVVRDLTGVTFTIHPHAFGLFGRDRKAVQREIESATAVVTISEYHRSYIAELCPGIAPAEIAVVHCGIEPGTLAHPSAEPAAGPLRIVSVGRAVEKKGHRYLIDACHRLAAAGVDFRCDMVVGDGQLRADLQDQIESLELGNFVSLLGAQSEDAVFELLGASHVFVLASVVATSGDRDGIPVSLMEAMACELPVVSTAVAGIPELVEHEVSGLLVAERDSAALADALRRLLEDEALRHRLGKRGRETVLEHFDAGASAARMADLFRRVVAEHGR